MHIELNILTSVVMYQLYQYQFSWFSFFLKINQIFSLVPLFNMAVTPKTLQGVLSSMKNRTFVQIPNGLYNLCAVFTLNKL